MDKKYPDLCALTRDDSTARHYFGSLPEHVRSVIAQHPGGVNSFENPCNYADNLTWEDR